MVKLYINSLLFRLVKNYWKDSVFVYGLGLVYFKYNSFRWATVAFQQVLYIDPGFSRYAKKNPIQMFDSELSLFRANEVHLRLGLIFKMKNDFDTSLKHFTLAKNDSSPCSFTPLEIR